jgi:SRSO17 transposase
MRPPGPAVEECFQAGKNDAALDHYQVRRYPPWYRYVTLAMLALAWLAVTRGPACDEHHARHWSRWRHCHQERARRCHYQRQQLQDH